MKIVKLLLTLTSLLVARSMSLKPPDPRSYLAEKVKVMSIPNENSCSLPLNLNDILATWLWSERPSHNQPSAPADFKFSGGSFLGQMTLLCIGLSALLFSARPVVSKRGHSLGLTKALLLSCSMNVVVSAASDWTLINE